MSLTMKKKSTKLVAFKEPQNFLESSRKYIFLGLIILILIYFVFRLKNYFSGPQILVYSPAPFAVIKTETFKITGNIQNAKSIYLNGREIQINQAGDFRETLIAKKPYLIVTLRAIDRYNQETFKVLTFGVDNQLGENGAAD